MRGTATLTGNRDKLKVMRFPPCVSALICIVLWSAPGPLAAQPTATPASAPQPAPMPTPGGPRIFFPVKDYAFGRVAMGEKVRYSFVVSNSGNQPLVISSVKPGCHCTTAGNWAHQAHDVAPGQTAQIPIEFDSSGLRGDVTRTITVFSNDKLAPVQTLSLKGNVWTVLEIRPRSATINLMSDSTNGSAVIQITNESGSPIFVSNPVSSTVKFTATLKTNVPGSSYALTVSAVPPFASGTTMGNISLNSSFSNMSVINITTIATMQPAVFYSPQQIPLIPEINRPMTNHVIVMANSRRDIVLSDLKCSDSQIAVSARAVVPGRRFDITAIVPTGYHLETGKTAELTAKVNDLRTPVIRIPIFQYPRRPGMAQEHPKVMSQIPPPPAPATAHP